jgi:hypothetical protein
LLEFWCATFQCFIWDRSSWDHIQPSVLEKCCLCIILCRLCFPVIYLRR